MAAKNPKEDARQFSFDIRGNQLVIQEPQTIRLFPGGEILRQILPQQDLWTHRPKGPFLVTNLQKGAVLQELNGVIVYSYPGVLPNVGPRDKFSGLIITVTNREIMGQTETLLELLLEAKNRLQVKSPVFILEQVAGKLDRNIRINTLAAAGIVDRNVTGIVNNYLLWRGRTPTPPDKVKRKPVDLLARYSADPQKRSYLEGLRRRVIAAYKKQGFILVNFDEIDEKLRASTFIPRELHNLEMGHGIEVRDQRCGCLWHIDLNGDAKLIPPACDDHRRNSGRKPVVPTENGLTNWTGQLKTYTLGERLSGLDCFDCPSTKLILRIEILSGTGNRFEILESLFCPHCGTVSSRESIVLRKQVVNL